MPVSLRKSRVKWLWWLKPERRPTSTSGISLSASSALARSTRNLYQVLVRRRPRRTLELAREMKGAHPGLAREVCQDSGRARSCRR